MNVFRIFLFAMVLTAMQVALSAINAFVSINSTNGMSFIDGAKQFIFTNYLAEFIFVTLLFISFGRAQKVSPYAHAFLVTVLSQFFGLASSFAVFGKVYFSEAAILDYSVLFFSALVGTSAGVRLANNKTT